MANNYTDLSDSNSELPALNLDDLDSDFGFPDDQDAEAGVVRRFVRGFRRGFLGGVDLKNSSRQFITAALPDGYTRTLIAAGQTQAFLRGIRGEVVKRSAADINEIVTRMRHTLPRIEARTPKRVYTLMERRLESLEEHLAEQLREDPSDEQVQKDADEALIAEALTQTGRLQTDLAKQQAAVEDTRHLESQIEAEGERKTRAQRFAHLTGQLEDIRTAQGHLVDYQHQITHRFYRNSLELQYRAYFALRDMRRTLQEQLETQQEGLEKLVHNTGLSDYQKSLVEKEAPTASHLTDFLARFYPTLQKNVVDQLASLLSTGASSLQMGEMAGGMVGGMPGGKAGVGGELLGGLLSEQLLNTFLPVLGSRASPYVSQFSDERLGGRHHLLNYWLNNAPSLLQDYATDTSLEYGWRSGLQNLVRSIVPTHFLDDDLTEGSYQNIEKQASFNHLTQRSLVEIIPGYLSRILHEVRIARTGDESLEREVYDITKGTWTTLTGAKTALAGRVITETQRRGIQTTVGLVMDEYDPNRELSPEARSALRDRLLRDASMNRHFDPARYQDRHSYGQGVDGETLDELQRFFSERIAVDERGRVQRDATNLQELNRLSDAFLQLRAVLPDPRDELRRITGMGSQELLRDLGLIYTSQGRDRINYDKLWALANGEEDEAVYSGYQHYNDPDVFVGPHPPDITDRARQTVTESVSRFGRSMRERLPGSLTDQPGPVEESATERQRWRLHRQDLPFVGDEEAEELVGPLPESRLERWRRQSQQTASSVSEFVRARLRRPAPLGPDPEASVDDPPPTLYSSTSDVPLLRSERLAAGEYIDVNTNRVIRTLKDITGPVANRAGEIIAAPRDFLAGLRKSDGSKVDSNELSPNLRAELSASETGPGLTRRVASEMGRGLTGAWLKTKDLYLRGQAQAVLLARDIRAGRYTDVNSGVVITDVEDITGEVVNEHNEVVLTEAEFQEGLVDHEGQEVVGTGSSRLRRWLHFSSRPGVALGRGLGSLARRLGGFLGGRLRRRKLDAYLPGEDAPVLTVNNLKRGRYQTEDGLVLTSFDDIDGPVFDTEGNEVVSAEQLAQLITRDGERHPVTRKPGLLRRMARAYGRMTRNYYRGLGRVGLKAAGALVRLGRRGVGRLFGRKGKVNEADMTTTTDALLARMVNLTEEQMPEKIRKGSWQDIFRRREEVQSEESEEQTLPKESRGLLASLGAGISNIFNLFKKREEDREGEGGDTTIIGDPTGLLNRDKSGKPKPTGKPQGRWARAKGAMGRSRLGRLALGVGGFAFGAGGWALRGVMAAGSLLLGALSAPVVATGIALGVAGYVGWRMYKRHVTKGGVLRQLRMAQYGIPPTEVSAITKVLALEGALDGAVDRSSHSQLVPARMNPEALFEAIELDLTDEDAIRQFARWLEQRFKPVYLAYHSALHNHAPHVTLLEIDKELPATAGLAVVEEVSFGGSGETNPYHFTDVPFTSEEPVTPEEIRTYLDTAKAHYQKLEEQSARKPAVSIIAGATQVDRDGTVMLRKRQRGYAPHAGLRDRVSDESIASQTALRNTPLLTAANQVVTMSATHAMDLVQGQQLTSLQAIRFYGYGSTHLTRAEVLALTRLEVELLKYVQLDGDREAKLDLGQGQILWELGNVFGLNTRQARNPQVQRFNTWLTTRFVPVFMAYILAVRKHDPSTANVLAANPALSVEQEYQVALALMAAKATYNGREISAWDIQEHPFDDLDIAAVRALAEREVAVFEERLKDKGLSTPGQGLSRTAANTAGMKAVDQGKWDPGTGERGHSRYQLTHAQNLARPDFVRQQTYLPQGQIIARGNTTSQMGTGKGGVLDAIPMPTSNRSYQGALPTLEAVSVITGVSLDLLVTFAGVESNYDYLIKAGTSTATGWFQFINATWDEMVKHHGPTYDFPPDVGRRLRLDPRANALMAAEYIRSNYKELYEATGRVPTDTDLYLAHFLGLRGALRFLGRDGGSIAADIFPKAANDNKPIFYKPSGAARTLNEVYALMDERLAKYRMGHGGVNPALPTANDDLIQTAYGEAKVDERGQYVPQVSQPSLPQLQQANDSQATPVLDRVSRTSSVDTANPQSRPLPIGMSEIEPETGTEDVEARVVREEAVRQRREALQQRSRIAEQQQQEHTARLVEGSQELSQIQRAQLKTQESMRDYLKTIVEELGVLKSIATRPAAAGDGSTEAPAPTTNDTTRPAPAAPPMRPSRAVGNTPIPVSLRR